MPLSKTMDEYQEVVEVLNRKIWDRRLNYNDLERWLNAFSDKDRQFALHILAHFTFFGHREIRELLRTLYRDLVRYPIIQSIRRGCGNTLDRDVIEQQYQGELEKTRFLGVGNPSESGTHLLYYFRQENNLSKELFINTHEIFDRSTNTSDPGRQSVALRAPEVRRYVFIDDLCGSGSQAVRYSDELVDSINALDSSVEVCYFALIGMDSGLKRVRDRTRFSRVDALFVLDESFQCFHSDSRYYLPSEQDARVYAENVMRFHGSNLLPCDPLGFNNGQLLLGFFHNIPDNTLPVIWSSESGWPPIFRRYDKKYK